MLSNMVGNVIVVRRDGSVSPENNNGPGGNGGHDGAGQQAGSLGDDALTKRGADKCHVLLVDRSRLTRECVVHLLQDVCPDLVLVPAETPHLPAHWDGPVPDLVIINTHSSSIADLRKSDIETARQHAVPLIAIMERVNTLQTFDALPAGVAGIFCLEDNSELLLAAIRLVLAGGRFLPPQVLP